MLSLTMLLMLAHCLGDFTHLSTPWMLRAKRFGTPILPIAAHGAVHAFLMAPIVYDFCGLEKGIYAFLIQFIVHTFTDVFKGKVTYLSPACQDSKNVEYWYLFGIDQYIHQLTILLIVAVSFYL